MSSGYGSSESSLNFAAPASCPTGTPRGPYNRKNKKRKEYVMTMGDTPDELVGNPALMEFVQAAQKKAMDFMLKMRQEEYERVERERRNRRRRKKKDLSGEEDLFTSQFGRITDRGGLAQEFEVDTVVPEGADMDKWWMKAMVPVPVMTEDGNYSLDLLRLPLLPLQPELPPVIKKSHKKKPVDPLAPIPPPRPPSITFSGPFSTKSPSEFIEGLVLPTEAEAEKNVNRLLQKVINRPKEEIRRDAKVAVAHLPKERFLDKEKDQMEKRKRDCELALMESILPKSLVIPTTKAALKDAKLSRAVKCSMLLQEIGLVTLRDDRVFDSCDVVRNKAIAFLSAHKCSRLGFLKALCPTNPMKPNSWKAFMSYSGEFAGNNNRGYYLAYYFFERLRIIMGVEKEEQRLKDEKDYKYGRPFMLHVEKPVLDGRLKVLIDANGEEVLERNGVLRTVIRRDREGKGMRSIRGIINGGGVKGGLTGRLDDYESLSFLGVGSCEPLSQPPSHVLVSDSLHHDLVPAAEPDYGRSEFTDALEEDEGMNVFLPKTERGFRVTEDSFGGTEEVMKEGNEEDEEREEGEEEEVLIQSRKI